MLTRYFASHRKILFFSIITGLIAAILLGSLQFFWSYHKREIRFDTLIKDVSIYMENYFEELKTSIDVLQPLTLNNCQDVNAEITSRAAFSINVRAFLLVRNKMAFCSSATGPMNAPMEELIPELHINKQIDIALLPGTPMLPNRPAIAIWYRNPLVKDGGVFTSVNLNLTPYLLYTARQEEFAGIAIIIGDNALSTASSTLVRASDLHQTPARTATLTEVPLTIKLYAREWTSDEILFALFFGLLCGIAAGSLNFYILTLRLNPGKEILSAIKRGQFYVVYQPVVDTDALQMRGVEVLMRWKHPTMGEIPPDAFINFAEAQKLIVPLTLHLFDLIIRDAPVLQTVLPPGAKLGINIAPGHLHAESFKDDMRTFKSLLPPDYFQIVLEITERDMLNHREASSLFEWLHNEGFEIAIDDFGTGHSALIYLEHFTMDYLKIDRGFVNAIGTETVTSPVLDAVLTLARKLNMLTVAEGVETPEQAAWLREHGVHFLQGYWISRPMPLEQFRTWQNKVSSQAE
ncbi:cyclic di-GMP phosphodiesterase [Enterobacter kobei]|uniref:cyclic di-GMP phosphodiesterase n=1 Tax=Enterobacter kobei TaxID=208224 RepID=UPI0020042A14|nr:cyclic di-GMP phosphodiesterase [Enterobacter kobei]MCK7004123.1 cyclic di-GMP phosphodiesterase [Enterobacter kobei]MEB7531074.1 cyclic di-GMP phosphodiesterase [Enterobacter kobei]HDR2340416.1 cyclic di-GMP phosphodiesterase [Enterobacter kobei]HDZ8194335.1 cyclic di-GMP phosphodiesterase [Enterobacter kobei]HEO9246961.1 cyclic di-GMP phosphodiesterase [Enterobacter kobei]